MKKIALVLIFLIAAGYAAPLAFAEETTGVDGVAGCGAVRLDPAASLDEQQTICGAAEGVAGTSCAAGGHGTCSSPKLNDTLPDADHCICVGEAAAAPVESDPVM